MSRQPKTYVTPEEYLAFERGCEYRNEYLNGEIRAMTGASREHNLIGLNIASELRARLKGRPCEVYHTDMRVRVPSANVYTYPDVVVVCGEPKFEDGRLDTLLNPTLLVEVLSKSTEKYDRTTKSDYYRTLESLEGYLLVSQDEYAVEQYTRQADGRWLLTSVRGLGSSAELRSLGCTLPLSDVYERVEL
jgi:Uma2 family endonuclease